ncbi:hypothetical protein SaccyDRAFT_2267 [Saccharomonospora cyanea NA-134]|uniref:Uncharacterized protein n=1 Tax=Saccharomonospora cyanea NA-134 TaxID=882082 RepID=H5XPS0_9PSEU|nr:hypothetical protein SaccyDRAFT_2267 [Saccharomonospora cyanea NA-134]
MDEEIERLTSLAVEYHGIGCSIAEIADLLVDKHPSLRLAPFRLAQVLRSTFAFRFMTCNTSPHGCKVRFHWKSWKSAFG